MNKKIIAIAVSSFGLLANPVYADYLQVESDTGVINPTNSAFLDYNTTITFKEGNGIKLNYDKSFYTPTGGPERDAYNHTITIGLKDGASVENKDISPNSVNVGGVQINSNGINSNNKKITNIADGEINDTSTDAVNGSQLHSTNTALNYLAAKFNRNIFSLTTNQPENGTSPDFDESKVNPIKAGSIINYKEGKNISISHSESYLRDPSEEMRLDPLHNIVIKTKDDLVANSYTVTGQNGKNDVVLNGNGLDMGNRTISNLNDGVKDNDAVNMSQLNKIQKQLDAMGNNTGNPSDNVQTVRNTQAIQELKDVTSKGIFVTDTNGSKANIPLNNENKPFKFSAGSKNVTVNLDNNDGLKFDLAKEVELDKVATKELQANNVVINKDGINAGNQIVSNVADGKIVENSKDAVNGGQVYSLMSNLATKAIKLEAGDNIKTTITPNGDVRVSTTPDLKSDSITLKNKVVINENGYNGGGEKVTNIADGEISENSSDAITGRQLYNALKNKGNDGLKQAFDKIGKVEDELSSAIAASNAMAGLSQVHQAGATMVSVGVGGYSNKQAVAIGVSGMSENGKWTYRLNGAIGVNKGHKNHRGSYSGSIGYQF